MVNVGKYTSAMHPMGREALEFFWTKQKLLECLLRISLQALGSWYLVSSKPCPQHVWQTRIHQAAFSLIYLNLGFESDAWKRGKKIQYPKRWFDGDLQWKDHLKTNPK